VLLAFSEMAKIRDAFSYWADNTCIRFREVPKNQNVASGNLLITNQPNARYAGRFLPRDASACRGRLCDSKLSVRLSVTLRYDFHIGCNTSKIISRPNSLRPMRLVTPTWAIWCNGSTPKFRVEQGWDQEHTKLSDLRNGAR